LPPDRPILAFDTAAAHCAAALLSEGRLLAEAVEPMDRGQAERLMPMLAGLLAQAGIGWRDLGAVAVGTGPGNFTGVRIAVAAARGLAFGLGVPAAGVTGFEALAAGRAGPWIASLPGRGGMALVAVAGPGGAGPATEIDPDAPPPGLPRLPVAGHAADRIAAALQSAGTTATVGAAAIARVAAARLAAGAPVPRPAPVYLRPPDAAPPADPPPVILP
jgi:tRNA threonylcarbamoyl adenosine modification protein YeaZ